MLKISGRESQVHGMFADPPSEYRHSSWIHLYPDKVLAQVPYSVLTGPYFREGGAGVKEKAKAAAFARGGRKNNRMILKSDCMNDDRSVTPKLYHLAATDPWVCLNHVVMCVNRTGPDEYKGRIRAP